MSTITTGKRSTTPKKRQTRSQSKSRNQEDVCVRTSLPPFVEGPVYASLICHIPKIRWNTKQQPSCRFINVKVSWWGEDDTSALFKPQILGTASSLSYQLSTTAKYYIRSELKQFAKYLTDAAELILKLFDSDTNRLVGTAKVQNLSTLSVNNSIKGFHSIFTNKGDKLGEIFVSLRIFLPGTYDSNENLTAMSVTSDVSNPPSRRSSFGANDYHQGDQLENGSRTYKLDRAYNVESLNTHRSNENIGKTPRFDSTVPFKPYTSDAQSDIQSHREQPTGKVVEALIERANRLREDMIKSSLEKNINNNNSEILTTQHQIKSYDIDPSIDNDNVCDMLGINTSLKLPGELNNSNDSILSDLDGLEGEQSLLDDLLYGVGSGDGATGGDHRISHHITTKHQPRGKPPSGRSRSPSVTRTGRLSHRSRSARSTDSDTASRVSFDMPSSDLDDSGNESHTDDDNLCTERIQILNHVRIARVRIDQLRLNELNTDRQSPSHSTFGRTNKSKRATTYFIEYQFPVIANSRDGQKNEATQVMKIASKRFETNNDIIFSHLSTYPCLFNETILKNWWRSLLIFKIFSRMSGSTSPEQIGFAVLPLRNILKAESLHLQQNLNVIDRTQINQQKLPTKVARKFCIGHLHVMLELDSDVTNFKIELDRLRLIEEMKPKRQTSEKTKKSKKKSKKIVVNPNTNLQLPKAFSSEGFMTNESSSELADGFVVQIYLSITEARNIPKISNNNNLPRNPYFVCRAFWNEEPITSVICWGSSSPRFNFEQKIPLLLTKSTLDKMHHNFVVIELWDKKISGSTDTIIGIIKVPLEQFHISFKDKQISRVLLRAQYPVISTDSWLPIIDPFTSTHKPNGDIQVLLAMGTSDQITAVQVAHANGNLSPASTNRKPTTESTPDETSSSSLVEHQFDIMLESINGLRAFESMVWGESDCFIQYSFPVQQEQDQLMNVNSIKPFQFRPIRTAATLCTSDPTFHDSNKFQYVLLPSDALHKYFYAACHSPSTLETCITFEVWSRFYYPNIRDQLLAKGKLPAAKLCSMTTMLNSNAENKSVQSFRIPLEIVREDPKHGHHHSSTPTYGGDLLISVTYRRNVVKKNERQALTDRLSSGTSQVCISVGIIRACGLKHAAQSQARHDARLNYPAQVGVNTYAKLTLSFLSNMESRTTRTIARSFVPEFNHSIDFPVPLIWNDNRNHTVSLAEMLEHGELKIDMYHQISSTDDSNQTSDKRSLDIHLCSCTISLKELISRNTGIKGWYSLASANRALTSDVSSDPSEHCVGGLELFVRFGQQEDRRRIIESAKTLGWFVDNYIDEENFLNDQKDLGCLVTLSIDRIQFPIQLATRPGKDRIDERTSVFVQYRLYDKMPIITKRKKPIVDRHNVICELKYTKEHLFLCSAPFLWYLREEKLEIQIWTSENDSYDYSPSVSSTDKHIGSIYVDLNSLCDRKRKSYRLNAILPMFKHGSKDLGGAFTQVHVTIDKSKDFNELRSRDVNETSNDAELDSYLENRQLNLIGNNHALRTITNNIFSVIINIEQAAHLSNIYSQSENAHTSPNPYVTYSTADSHHLCRTQVLTSTNKPIWNYQQAVKLSVEHLFNDKKTFILKVWHKVNADIETIPEKSGDKVLGFVSIDLSALLSGLQQISGWYNIVDTIGNVQGQLKISIVPQEDLFELKRFKYKSNQNQTKTDSHRSTSTSSGSVPPIVFNDLSARSSGGQASLNTSMIDDESNKKSFLMNNLHRQLGELGAITDRLKARLLSGSETSSITNESTSTLTTARCTSVPPPSTSMPVHMNTNQQNLDTNRSTTATTIQTDLLEHFPESLSGRPLMSDGLNITDVLSLHNNQVRLAQELMTKANHLLESSKDFFNKPSTSPPPPPATHSLSTIVEKQPSLSPPPPPALPNFNTTTEFQTRERSPPIAYETNEHTNHSFVHQHPNNSILWSDEDDNDDHNQSFLPIGLPPIQHRLATPTVNSPRPPVHIEETVTHEEQPDDIDVVHIRPLNNLSAFNFDCQQMNAERLNDTLSPKPSTRRTIFPTHTSVDDKYQQISSISSYEHQLQQSSPTVIIERRSLSSSSSSSSSSATPPASSTQKPRESFTSDTSVIDTNWIEQQRQQQQHDANTLHIPPLSLPSDRSNTNRTSGRSPHLAFLDRPIPNFFPTNHEFEASVKHVSQALSNQSTARTTTDPSSPSSTVMKTIIDRLRTKSSNELLRGVSPVNGNLGQPTETTNVTRLEKIFKTKYTTNPPSN